MITSIGPRPDIKDIINVTLLIMRRFCKKNILKFVSEPELKFHRPGNFCQQKYFIGDLEKSFSTLDNVVL